jgi:DnaJ-class molecular chaperone
MPEKNHYELLEVSRSATPEDVREQYRMQMYKYHPDHNPGNEEWAVSQTVALVEACKVLCDPKARSVYDFKISNRMREMPESKGIGLFKGAARKEAEARFLEGVHAWKQERALPAVESFKLALRADASFSDAAYNLALALAIHGHAHSALELLGKACKDAPKDEGLGKLKNAISRTFLSA